MSIQKKSAASKTGTSTVPTSAAHKPAVTWKTSLNKDMPVNSNEPKSICGRRNNDLDAQQTPSEIIMQVDAVHDRMRVAFEKFLAKQGWTNARAYREFSPYISNPAAVTKILKGEQRLAFEVLLIMALRFEEPLDEVLLGQKPSSPVLTTSEQEVILQLAERIKSCSCSKD